MSWGFKCIQSLRYASRKTKVLTGTAGILVGTAVGLKWEDWSSKKKGQRMFGIKLALVVMYLGDINTYLSDDSV